MHQKPGWGSGIGFWSAWWTVANSSLVRIFKTWHSSIDDALYLGEKGAVLKTLFGLTDVGDLN